MRRLLLLLFLLAIKAQKNGTEVEVTDDKVVEKRMEETADKAKEEAEKKNEEVKNELDRAVQNLNASQTTAKGAGPSLGLPLSGLPSCSAVDCNNRGTCIGSKKAFICACQLGFTGRTCEETMCDSVRDCNGRGLCFGTSSTLTCICQLGFGGPRCETSF